MKLSKQNKKYELTGKTINHYSRTLHQIRRISDGLIGGYIEKESNLSYKGNCFVFDNAKVFSDARVSGDCFVYDNAKVCGNAWVYDNAWVSGNARVRGNAWVCGDAKIKLGEISSKKDYIIFICGDYPATAIKEGVQIGCMFDTYDNWLSIKKEKFNIEGFTMYYEYKSFIQFAKEYFKRRNK